MIMENLMDASPFEVLYFFHLMLAAVHELKDFFNDSPRTDIIVQFVESTNFLVKDIITMGDFRKKSDAFDDRNNVNQHKHKLYHTFEEFCKAFGTEDLLTLNAKVCLQNFYEESKFHGYLPLIEFPMVWKREKQRIGRIYKDISDPRLLLCRLNKSEIVIHNHKNNLHRKIFIPRRRMNEILEKEISTALDALDRVILPETIDELPSILKDLDLIIKRVDGIPVSISDWMERMYNTLLSGVSDLYNTPPILNDQ